MMAEARHGPRPRVNRRAGPWSGMKASVRLSIKVVTTTESTGSRSISMAGSTSCRMLAAAAAGAAGPWSVHMRGARYAAGPAGSAGSAGSGGGAGRVVAAISSALSTYTR